MTAGPLSTVSKNECVIGLIVERKSLTKVMVKGVSEEVKHAKPILYLRLRLQKKGKQTPCNNERLNY